MVIIVPVRLSSGVMGGIHFGEAWTIWMDQERLLREGYTANRKVAADRARGMAIRKLRTWQRRNYRGGPYRHVVWAI